MKIQVKNADSNPKKRLIVSKDTSQTISCLIALLILIVLFSVMSPYFLSSDNLANVLTQIITTALLGFGMTYVIISGEIDLSTCYEQCNCGNFALERLSDDHLLLGWCEFWYPSWSGQWITYYQAVIAFLCCNNWNTNGHSWFSARFYRF